MHFCRWDFHTFSANFSGLKNSLCQCFRFLDVCTALQCNALAHMTQGTHVPICFVLIFWNVDTANFNFRMMMVMMLIWVPPNKEVLNIALAVGRRLSVDKLLMLLLKKGLLSEFYILRQFSKMAELWWPVYIALGCGLWPSEGGASDELVAPALLGCAGAPTTLYYTRLRPTKLYYKGALTTLYYTGLHPPCCCCSSASISLASQRSTSPLSCWPRIPISLRCLVLLS